MTIKSHQDIKKIEKKVAVAKPVGRSVPPIPKPPELEPVAVRGSYTDQVSVIPKTHANLHLTIGITASADDANSQNVLVPFIELQLDGGAISDLINQDEQNDQSENLHGKKLFSTNLSIENFAFVVLDLASELKRICSEVTSISNSNLAIDPSRMAHVRYFVAHLERQARICRIKLDREYGEPESSESK